MWLKIMLVTLAVSSVLCEDYKTTSFAIPLTRGNFHQQIADNDILVLFYMPDCELAQKFIPIFEKLAEQYNAKTVLKLGSVNCATSPDLCAGYVGNCLEIHLYKKDEGHVKFIGVRDPAGIAKFLVKYLGDEILDNILEMPERLDAMNELTDDTFANHIAIGQHFVKFYAPWCGHCQKLAPIWEELASSLEHDDTVSISRLDCTQFRPICREYDVKSYPTLLWIVDGKNIEKYTGARTLENLKDYVEKAAGRDVSSSDISDGSHAPEHAVLSLTAQSFEHTIEKGITLVKFFAPWCGHCKRLAPTWDELAAKYVGNPYVKVAKVDCTIAENKELCAEQEVNGFPTIFIYKNGNKLSEYDGSRSLEDLYDFVNRYNSREEL